LGPKFLRFPQNLIKGLKKKGQKEAAKVLACQKSQIFLWTITKLLPLEAVLSSLEKVHFYQHFKRDPLAQLKFKVIFPHNRTRYSFLKILFTKHLQWHFNISLFPH
jgi:hypothetical protein